MLDKIIGSKKVVVTFVALLAAVLTSLGLPISPEIQTLLVKGIVAIAASFNVGQGIADGISKGRTSASFPSTELLDAVRNLKLPKDDE